MRKLLLIFSLLFLLVQFNFAQRKMENLDRGLLAQKVATGVYVNWRITGQEWFGTSYNIYRDGVKLNSSPITGASNYTDATGTASSKYTVSSIDVNGVESAQCAPASVQTLPYKEIVLVNLGVSGYEPNDVTVADLDGDGEMEILLKRLYPDWSPTAPYYSRIEAYKQNGTLMWAINVGPNIISDVENNVAAFDFDGDGKAEVFMRTSEGTIFGDGTMIGDTNGDGITNYRPYSWAGTTGDYPNYSTYLCKGPEFLSLIDGETGKELDRVDYIPREFGGKTMEQIWGDNYGHRANKFFFGAPYLDGKKPSIFIARGIYTRTVMRTYDVVNKKLQFRWEFNTDNDPAYAGQGNHNYTIADVDNDGKDEIVYGSMTVDHDGKGLYSTGLGHGDAMHVSDFDPYRRGLEVFACHEHSPYGTSFRDAATGEILIRHTTGSDCGRCNAANVTENFAGAELWGGSKMFSATTRQTTPGSTSGGSENFAIFWDGDLLQETFNYVSTTNLEGNVWKYGVGNLMTTSGAATCNGTKGTPCMQVDLYGDWREELIMRSADNKSLRIYSTTYPTNYRYYTLLHDMQYRQAIAWQMCGYNQPPHVSFFLGETEGITVPPPPMMDNQKLVFTPSSTTWATGSNNWKKDGVSASLKNGDDILFDVSGHASNITLSGTVSPKTMTVNSPNDYVMNMQSGKLSGKMILIKQGEGSFSFNGTHDYTGKTEIWNGLVNFDGTLQNSPVWLNLFGELAAKGTIAKTISMNYGSILYPGGKNGLGSLTISEGKLELKNNSIVEFDLGDNLTSDKLIVANNTLVLSSGVEFRINNLATNFQYGEYIIGEAKELSGSVDDITITGLDGKVTTLSFKAGKLILNVEATRSSASIVWTGKKEGSLWNFATDYNFLLNGTDAFFVVDDAVLFDDSAISKTVNVSGTVIPAFITVNASDAYTIQGSGIISGTTGLIKSGTGKLTMKGQHDFTGATVVNDGVLAVESLPYLSYNGSIGQKSDNPELFVLNGGTLTTTGVALTSERALKIGAKGATINTNASIDWKSVITGGVLTKTGSHALTLYAANTFSKLLVQGGTVALAAEVAYPGKDIVLSNGALLKCFNSNGTYSLATWNVEVAEGTFGAINLDSRCDYTGTLKGGGTLTVMSPWVRSYLKGNWSAFTGKIIATTDNDGGNFSFYNNYGLPNAELFVNGKLYVAHETGASFSLGALSGTSAASLGGTPWVIGSKNITTTFEGKIESGSITKVGTETLILTNVNGYTGGTTINGGRVLAQNSTGCPLGTGTVTINNGGVLGGTAPISGTTYVKAGGTIEPGNHTVTTWSQQIGSMTFNNGLNLASGANVNISVRNMGNNPSDLITVKGNFVVSGNLNVEIVNGSASFTVGAKVKIFDLTGANSVTGNFTTHNLPPTEANSSWDVSKLLTEGTIEVVVAMGVNSGSYESFKLYPNPAHDYVIINDDNFSGNRFEISFISLDGSVAYRTTASNNEKINISQLPNSIYIINVKSEGKNYYSKLIKK